MYITGQFVFLKHYFHVTNPLRNHWWFLQYIKFKVCCLFFNILVWLELILPVILYCFLAVLFILFWLLLLSFSVVILSSTTCRKPFSLPSPPPLLALNINSVKPWRPNLSYIFSVKPCLTIPNHFSLSEFMGPTYGLTHLECRNTFKMYFILSFLHFQKFNITEVGTERNAEKEKEMWIGKGPGNLHLLGEEAQIHL